MSDIGVILLAAGASTRMGQPKQLIEFRGKTLLRRAVEAALEARGNPVIVVLGADVGACAAEIDDLRVIIERNPEWRGGMGTSIRRGVTALLGAQPDVAGAIVMLCDQPHIGAADLRRLVDAFEGTGRPVCAAAYADTIGVPCLFAREWFAELAALPDEAGAKFLIQRGGGSVVRVPMPAAGIDLDTPEDVAALEGSDGWI